MSDADYQEPVAYEVHWQGHSLARPYLVFANEKPSEHWTPAPRCVPLYRQPQPTLTYEEREAIKTAIEWSPIYEHPAAVTLRSLLERLK